MQPRSMCFVLGFAGLAGTQPARGQETILSGTIRTATSRAPIAGAVVAGEVAVAARDSVGSYKLHLPSVVTDSTGRFTLRLPRTTSRLEVSRPGFLDFQYPLLALSVDTLVTDIELRPDPVPPELYVTAGRGYLPFLCVIVDNSAKRFDVLHSCQRSAYDSTLYSRQGYKHNPWSPYFGAAGDRGGVFVYTRIVRAGQRR